MYGMNWSSRKTRDGMLRTESSRIWNIERQRRCVGNRLDRARLIQYCTECVVDNHPGSVRLLEAGREGKDVRMSECPRPSWRRDLEISSSVVRTVQCVVSPRRHRTLQLVPAVVVCQ